MSEFSFTATNPSIQVQANQNLKDTIDSIKGQKNHFEGATGAKVSVNESVGQAAFYYEKLRNAIDYQDEHLFLKNAIKRILKRRTYLGARGNGLALLKELVWAKYFPNNTVPISIAEDIESILRKYSYFRENVKINGASSTNLFLAYASCEIEELLCPGQEKESYFAFCKQILKEKIDLKDEMEEETVAVQTDISIRKVILKEDLDQLRYRIMKHYYPDWPKVKKNEGERFTQEFASYHLESESQIEANKSSKILKYIKRNSPPFKIILESIYKGAMNFERNVHSEEGLNSLIRAEIAKKNENIRDKVLRSTVRGIIFILLTKIVLALVIEMPYEINVMKQINWPALLTNVFLPPFLMVIIGALIKIPPAKNTDELTLMASSIVFHQNLTSKSLTSLKEKRSNKFVLFNTIYSLMAVGVLSAVIWLLINLKFNIISIILFYVFVSLVSFLGFRIRSIAKEYEVRPEQDSVISGLYNFVLFPFVVIGKFLSDRWSEYNITLLFWDFIIEAPFKAVIGLFEAWLAFSREKREEFE